MKAPTDIEKGLAFHLAFAALLMGAIAMGASPIFVRFAEVGPFASAFWRVALALPVLLVWAWLEVGAMPSFRFGLPVLAAGIFFAGDLTFWHLAILNTTVANATLMACLAPLWVLLFSKIAIGEPAPPNAFAGLALCLIGAAMLIGSSYTIEPDRIIGDLYGVMTSFFFGLYFLAIRVARRTLESGELLLSSTIVTTLILLAIALFAGARLLPDTIYGYASLMALGVFSHAGGQGLLALALGSLTAGFSSLVIFIEALAAAIFGWIIFSENMGIGQLGGAVLILSGVWVARPRTRG